MMTKNNGIRIGKKNKRTNLVAPGAVNTDMNKTLRDNKEVLEKC